MDWGRAVEINRIALTRVVAEIFALVGLMRGGRLDRLPNTLYAAAERLLRPAESALRRLIVIAARGLVVEPSPKRPMPKGLVIARTGTKNMLFRLFDKRKRFDFIKTENPLFITVKTYSHNPFNPFSTLRPVQIEAPVDGVTALQFSRRLEAMAHALETIPQQAKRLARWKARRKTLDQPKFTSPLRLGAPPGQRQKPSAEVDFILRECHGLAWDVLKEESG